MQRLGEKAGVLYCQGLECIPEWLGHPNAPGWAQTVGSLLAVWVAINVAKGPSRQRIADRAEVRQAGIDIAKAMHRAYVLASENLRDKDAKGGTTIATSKHAIIELAAELRRIDLTMLPDAKTRLITYQIDYLIPARLKFLDRALTQKIAADGIIDGMTSYRLDQYERDFANWAQQLTERAIKKTKPDGDAVV